MKVTSIGLYSSNDVEVAMLSFRDPGSLNPYIAKEIVGLDADEIVPRFYGLSSNANEKYFDLSIPSREVVLSIMLNPTYGELDKSYSDLRDDIYKALASSRTGIMGLRLYNKGAEIARISGFVVKMESPQFTNAPEIQLSLRCTDPMLKGPEPTSLSSGGSNGSMKLDVSDSTAPHGFKFKATFTSHLTSFFIEDTSSDWRFEVIPLIPFENGDELHFSSEAGDKDFHAIQAGSTIQLIDRVTTTSIWPILFPGENHFNHTPEVIWDSITYHPTYWGV
jgi:hypothetical protein